MIAQSFIPVLVVVALGLIHRLYHHRYFGLDGQQVILLPELGYRSVRGAARFDPRAVRNADDTDRCRRLAGVFQTIRSGSLPTIAASELFKSFGPIARLGKRIVVEGDLRIADERHVDTLICMGDLTIKGDCVFLSPIKVVGDLTVTGNAAFLKPVVVGGHTVIDGLAAVFAGLVVKRELSVNGRLLVGDRDREGWVAATELDARGNLLLNGYVDITDGEDGAQGSAPLWRTVGAPTAIAVIGWLLAGPLGAVAANLFAHADCHATIGGASCAYSSVAVGPTTAEGLLGIFLLSVLLVAQRWFHAQMAYPFVAVMATLGLFAISYDTLIGLPIVGEARIVNDTMNVLQAIILASFILTFLVLRRLELPLMRVVAAVALSLAAKTTALVLFVSVQRAIGGAAELVLLFALYAFGAFSLHLMAIAGLVRHARAPQAAALAIPATNTRRVGTAVEGLRGLAIALVVIYHYTPPTLFSFNLGKPINSILFVVAGFFFARALGHVALASMPSVKGRVRTLMRVLARRHVRIWPLLAIVVALYLGLSVVDHGALTQQIRSTWPYYLTYLGYVPRWSLEAQAFPGHLWVVSAQETIIVLFCLAVAIMGWPRVQKSLAALIVVGAAARLGGTIAFMPLHPSLALETPWAILDPFAIGMLVQIRLAARSSQRRLRRQVAAAVVATGVVWMLLPNWPTTYFTLIPLIAALATALVMVVSADRVRGRRLNSSALTHPMLLFLGRISFPLFLLHPFVNTVLRLGFTSVIGFEMPWWTLLAIGPPLSALAALGLQRLVDAPLRRVVAAIDASAPRVSDLATTRDRAKTGDGLPPEIDVVAQSAGIAKAA